MSEIFITQNFGWRLFYRLGVESEGDDIYMRWVGRLSLGLN